MTWTLVDRDALLGRTGDPFVRYAAPSDALGVTGPHGWGVLLRWRAHGHWGGGAFCAPGAPAGAESDALTALLEAGRPAGVVGEWFSTADGRDLRVPSPYVEAGEGRWDFQWTAQADDLPPAPGGLVELDDTTDAELIHAFGAEHNGSFEGFPGWGFARLWLGVQGEDGLIAVGAVHQLASGAPHLAGIVVDRARRGEGLGLALTAELTRRAVRGWGVATLGVYSDNTAALGVYDRLGYRTARRLHTRVLGPAPQAVTD